MAEATVQNSNSSLINDQSSLLYLIREPKTKSVVQKGIILLHGVGSNEQSLFRFADYFPDDFYVIVPRGLFTLGPGRYAWYQVNFSTGRPVINAAQEKESRSAILDFVKGMKQKYNLEEVYLGGFSQGAIMSYTIGLTHPSEVTGIIALSGRIVSEIKPFVQPGKALQQLKVFIAHGVQDTILPVFHAREAKEYLQQSGVQLSYYELEMGHQINDLVVEEMNRWLL